MLLAMPTLAPALTARALFAQGLAFLIPFPLPYRIYTATVTRMPASTSG